MAGRAQAQPDLKAYDLALRLPPPEVVDKLITLLGARLVAYLAEVKDQRTVRSWATDAHPIKSAEVLPRLRLALHIALFLAEANEFNGPLMFIPKSHRNGRLEAGHDVTTTSYPLWTVDNETITRLVAEGGIVAPKGPPGS